MNLNSIPPRAQTPPNSPRAESPQKSPKEVSAVSPDKNYVSTESSPDANKRQRVGNVDSTTSPIPTATVALVQQEENPRLGKFSALKITNPDRKGNDVKYLESKLREGYRWVSSGFISDIGYKLGDKKYYSAGYVIVQDDSIEQLHGDGDYDACKAIFDELKCEIVLSGVGEGDTLAYFIDIAGKIQFFKIDPIYYPTIESVRNNLNDRFGDGFQIKTLNPVTKARQMPEFAIGDWVVFEGKSMRLIKAKSPHQDQDTDSTDNSSNSDQLSQMQQLPDLLLKRLEELSLATPVANNATNRTLDNLPKDWFKDSYARVAAAYIRRLERYPYLLRIFSRFFEKKEVKKPIAVKLYGRDDKRFNSFILVKFKDKVEINEDDIKLIRKGLGIVIDRPILRQESLKDIIPLKKILEIIACYNPNSEKPWLVNIFSSNKLLFLISQDDKQPKQLLVSQLLVSQLLVSQLLVSQLLVSLLKGNSNKRLEFQGNTYSWWVTYNNIERSQLVDILDQPISTLDESSIKPDSIQFLACTHIVESHFTPSALERSRVPGTAKLARSIINKSTDDSLSPYFDIKKKTKEPRFFPMAGTGGTGQTRNAVNQLIRYEDVDRGNNSECGYMSDDSEV